MLAIAAWAGKQFRNELSAGSNPAPQPNHVASVVTRSTCDNDAVDIGGGSSLLTTALFYSRTPLR